MPEVSTRVLRSQHEGLRVQGIAGLLNRQEAQCSGSEARRRQFAEVAGTVLLDVEMTVKLVSQGKVCVACSSHALRTFPFMT
jgi:hypothetical protein